jgi:hypothetical protein
VQLGTQPFLDLHRTWNLQLKLALLEGGPHRTALVLGGYRLPAPPNSAAWASCTARASPTRTARCLLFPVAVAHSWAVSERLHIHSALTTLFRHASDPRERRTSLGAATMIEARTASTGPRACTPGSGAWASNPRPTWRCRLLTSPST